MYVTSKKKEFQEKCKKSVEMDCESGYESQTYGDDRLPECAVTFRAMVRAKKHTIERLMDAEEDVATRKRYKAAYEACVDCLCYLLCINCFVYEVREAKLIHLFEKEKSYFPIQAQMHLNYTSDISLLRCLSDRE